MEMEIHAHRAAWESLRIAYPALVPTIDIMTAAALQSPEVLRQAKAKYGPLRVSLYSNDPITQARVAMELQRVLEIASTLPAVSPPNSD